MAWFSLDEPESDLSMTVQKRSPYLFTTNASFQGGMTLGGATNAATTASTGRLTFAGTARNQREMIIPWTWFAAGSANTSASSDAGTAASLIDADTLSGSIPCLGFRNTTSACGVFATAMFPVDADTSGSVKLYADWSFAKTTASVARIGACAYYVQAGSVISDAGAFAGSGLVVASAISSTACSMTTTQIATLRSFSASTTGVLAIRFWRDATNASDVSGSEFRFLGLRMRYLSNNFGPASTE